MSCVHHEISAGYLKLFNRYGVLNFFSTGVCILASALPFYRLSVICGVVFSLIYNI